MEVRHYVRILAGLPRAFLNGSDANVLVRTLLNIQNSTLSWRSGGDIREFSPQAGTLPIPTIKRRFVDCPHNSNRGQVYRLCLINCIRLWHGAWVSWKIILQCIIYQLVAFIFGSVWKRFLTKTTDGRYSMQINRRFGSFMHMALLSHLGPGEPAKNDQFSLIIIRYCYCERNSEYHFDYAICSNKLTLPRIITIAKLSWNKWDLMLFRTNIQSLRAYHSSSSCFTTSNYHQHPIPFENCRTGTWNTVQWE